MRSSCFRSWVGWRSRLRSRADRGLSYPDQNQLLVPAPAPHACRGARLRSLVAGSRVWSSRLETHHAWAEPRTGCAVKNKTKPKKKKKSWLRFNSFLFFRFTRTSHLWRLLRKPRKCFSFLFFSPPVSFEESSRFWFTRSLPTWLYWLGPLLKAVLGLTLWNKGQRKKKKVLRKRSASVSSVLCARGSVPAIYCHLR